MSDPATRAESIARLRADARASLAAVDDRLASLPREEREHLAYVPDHADPSDAWIEHNA